MSGWSAPEDEKNLISSVFARYQQELKTLNAVDFDDLLLCTDGHAGVLRRGEAVFMEAGQAALLEAPGPDVAHSCTSYQCVSASAATTCGSVCAALNTW